MTPLSTVAREVLAEAKATDGAMQDSMHRTPAELERERYPVLLAQAVIDLEVERDALAAAVTEWRDAEDAYWGVDPYDAALGKRRDDAYRALRALAAPAAQAAKET